MDIIYLIPTHATVNLYLTALDFLRKELEYTGKSVLFIYFNSEQKNIFAKGFPAQLIKYDPKANKDLNLLQEGRLLEKELNISFKHLSVSEKIQQNNRILLNEKNVNKLNHHIFNCLELEKVFSDHQPELVIRSQSTVTEFYFTDEYCTQKGIKQIIYEHDFFDRILFYKTLYNSRAELHHVIHDNSIDDKATSNFIQHRRTGGNYRNRTPKRNLGLFLKHQFNFNQLLFLTQKKINKGYSLFKKLFLYSRSYDQKEFILFPLHQPNESTLIWRGHPHVDQVNLISNIARNLPLNMLLVVKEHPNCKEHFSYYFLKKINRIPNVRVISPKININELIKKCKALVVLNNTTGYEAIMQNKPVIAFSPSAYSKHSEVFFVYNLFDLDKIISRAVDYKPDKTNNFYFIQKLLKESVQTNFAGFRIQDEKDAKDKAGDMAKAILNIFNQ